MGAVEIMVLRHQFGVLRCQVARPRFWWSDRVLGAALASLVSRERWAAFLITPETGPRLAPVVGEDALDLPMASPRATGSA
jgi:hypothetical protein